MRDPVALFADWWEAEKVPVVVATASRDGRPAARAVRLEGYGEDGFLFWSSSESPKASDLAQNPRCALVFLWDADRQVRVEGRVERVSEEENERQWQRSDGKRPLAAFAQSEPVASRSDLERLLERVPPDPPRPPFWVGYRVVPEAFEFWQYDAGFVHDRFRVVPDGSGWRVTRLQP